MSSLLTPRPPQRPAVRFPPSNVKRITDAFSSGYGPMMALASGLPCLWLDPAALLEGSYQGMDLNVGHQQPVHWSAQAAGLHIKAGGTAESIPFNNRPVINSTDKNGNLRMYARIPSNYTIYCVFSMPASEYANSEGGHSTLVEVLDERTGITSILWEWVTAPDTANGSLQFTPNGGSHNDMDGLLLSAADTPMVVAVTFDPSDPAHLTSKQYINDNTIRATKTNHTSAPTGGDLKLYVGARIYGDHRGLKGSFGAVVMYPRVHDATDIAACMANLRGAGMFNF